MRDRGRSYCRLATTRSGDDRYAGTSPSSSQVFELPHDVAARLAGECRAGHRLAHVDVAILVNGDAFRHRIIELIADRAVLRATNEDTLLHVVVNHIERVVRRDVDSARRPELRPLVEEVPVRVEDLNPVVRSVADQQPAA